MSKYTDEDVQQLVGLVASIPEYPYFHEEIKRALAPFRPDPEEELIEAMHVAFSHAVWPTLRPGNRFDVGIGNTAFPDEVVKGLAAALAVIKEKGYFNDQR